MNPKYNINLVTAKHADESSSRSLSFYFTPVLVVMHLYCVMDFQKILQARHAFAETQPEV